MSDPQPPMPVASTRVVELSRVPTSSVPPIFRIGRHARSRMPSKRHAPGTLRRSPWHGPPGRSRVHRRIDRGPRWRTPSGLSSLPAVRAFGCSPHGEGCGRRPRSLRRLFPSRDPLGPQGASCQRFLGVHRTGGAILVTARARVHAGVGSASGTAVLVAVGRTAGTGIVSTFHLVAFLSWTEGGFTLGSSCLQSDGSSPSVGAAGTSTSRPVVEL